ncbi:thiamine-phosphate kinase [Rhodoblastus sp.]|uniref:thiamine-phosphate kinase n=1 Tax=Rhodoblastus sp. TaxID=1962975 RepID=UPI002602BDF8|nr:thiamine-phosphate kinase [Rhodoblastus sp.]
MNEVDLIARYFAPLAGPEGLGLGDDAALLAPPAGCDLVLTADALVAGRHFFSDDPPDSVAAKALGVNLSDLAAKGAEPLGFLLTLALPPDWTEDWLDDFATGLGAAAKASSIALFGGDTVSTPGALTLSVTALGAVPHGRMIRRAGACVGDLLYVSGTIGDAALGVIQRRAQVEGQRAPLWADEFLLGRYLRPQPRLALIPALRRCASAAMDVSDGLIGDARALARASGAAVELRLGQVPLSPAAGAALSADPTLFDAVLTGGDDYEILCAVAPDHAVGFEESAEALGVVVACIGRIVERESILGSDGAPVFFGRDRFSHF